MRAPVAQGIEQRFPKPLVGSSIPPRGASLILYPDLYERTQ